MASICDGRLIGVGDGGGGRGGGGVLIQVQQVLSVLVGYMRRRDWNQLENA